MVMSAMIANGSDSHDSIIVCEVYTQVTYYIDSGLGEAKSSFHDKNMT